MLVEETYRVQQLVNGDALPLAPLSERDVLFLGADPSHIRVTAVAWKYVEKPGLIGTGDEAHAGAVVKIPHRLADRLTGGRGELGVEDVGHLAVRPQGAGLRRGGALRHPAVSRACRRVQGRRFEAGRSVRGDLGKYAGHLDLPRGRVEGCSDDDVTLRHGVPVDVDVLDRVWLPGYVRSGN